MTSGYGDKEREFLDALQADTGRSLAQWMEAISAAQLGGRNDIIDWLRRQGFRFSRASWLERVHHNGGQPIYAGRAATARPAARSPAGPPRSVSAAALGSRPLQSPPQPLPPPKQTTAPPRAAADAYGGVPLATSGTADPLSPQITAVTAKAKAYRPLADYLLRETVRNVPDVTFVVRGVQISMIAHGHEFAVLAIGSRELKLSVAQDAAMALSDARQIDEALLRRIVTAASA